MGLAAGAADLSGGGFDLRACARGEPDFRAGLGERDGARAADAAPGAGDEGDAAVEAEAIGKNRGCPYFAGVVSFFAPRPTFCPP